MTVTFGPTPRQRRLSDPPEKVCNLFGKEAGALKFSLSTIHKQVARRDAQSQELCRQLGVLKEVLAAQTAEPLSCTRRLQDLLADPLLAPRLQAEELARLQHEVGELLGSVRGAVTSEQHWGAVARRQQTFFMQRERLMQEGGAQVIHRHPAGELALAPLPVAVDGDEEDCRKQMWDVGTYVLDPYSIDSWPFEPNVLKDRCTLEPNLHVLEEDEDAELEAVEDSSSDGEDYEEGEELEDREAEYDSEVEVLPECAPHNEARSCEETAAAAAAAEAICGPRGTSAGPPPPMPARKVSVDSPRSV